MKTFLNVTNRNSNKKYVHFPLKKKKKISVPDEKFIVSLYIYDNCWL